MRPFWVGRRPFEVLRQQIESTVLKESKRFSANLTQFNLLRYDVFRLRVRPKAHNIDLVTLRNQTPEDPEGEDGCRDVIVIFLHPLLRRFECQF